MHLWRKVISFAMGGTIRQFLIGCTFDSCHEQSFLFYFGFSLQAGE